MKIRIKVEKVTEFGERIKKVQKEAEMVLKKLQECYGSRLKGLSQETTLVLSNTRELDRVLSTE